METTPAQPAPLSADPISAIAIKRIIQMAKILAADPEYDKWKVYNAAAHAMKDFYLPAGEYQHAIRELAAALDV